MARDHGEVHRVRNRRPPGFGMKADPRPAQASLPDAVCAYQLTFKERRYSSRRAGNCKANSTASSERCGRLDDTGDSAHPVALGHRLVVDAHNGVTPVPHREIEPNDVDEGHEHAQADP